jgi:hypothetical protein
MIIFASILSAIKGDSQEYVPTNTMCLSLAPTLDLHIKWFMRFLAMLFILYVFHISSKFDFFIDVDKGMCHALICVKKNPPVVNMIMRGRRVRMVVEFTITCEISAYHH